MADSQFPNTKSKHSFAPIPKEGGDALCAPNAITTTYLDRHKLNLIKQFGLTDKEAENLVGALQCIIEELLNKKYHLQG